jgi:phosphatidylinositol-3-phosphatase
MRKTILGLAAALLVVAATAGGAAPGRAAAVPGIKHVFVIVLENENFEGTFGPTSQATYLVKTLEPQGKLLTQYYATGHASLDNYITMISGQPPNAITQADCLVFAPFTPGVVGPDGVAVGQGCVYPPEVKTVADQLDDKGLTWKAYMGDMGNDPVRDNGVTCAHPPLGLLSQDKTQSAAANDQYATRHNPFVYFRSIIDRPACAENVVPLTRMPADLTNASTTANFTFITPNLCDDGHDTGCANGDPGGVTQMGRFLSVWVPKILASPAYKQDGALVITVDEADTSDASACCGEQTGPNTPLPGIGGAGGGRIGALVLSRFAKPGTSPVPYNHYSLLRSVEDIFGLGHLAYAAAAGPQSFGPDVFDNPTGVLATAAAAPARTIPTRVLPVTGGNRRATAEAVAAVLALVALALRRRSSPTN